MAPTPQRKDQYADVCRLQISESNLMRRLMQTELRLEMIEEAAIAACKARTELDETPNDGDGTDKYYAAHAKWRDATDRFVKLAMGETEA